MGVLQYLFIRLFFIFSLMIRHYFSRIICFRDLVEQDLPQKYEVDQHRFYLDEVVLISDFKWQ